MNDTVAPSPPVPNWRWLFPVTVALSLIADQWSKAAIIDRLALDESWRPWAGTPILELFAFTHIKNSGAAFGMLQQGGWLFVIIAVVVTFGILLRFRQLPKWKPWLFAGLGLIQGGALGNVVDRLRIGHVTDFIHVGTFAIFNIADAAIFCGVVLLVFMMWREEQAEERARAAEAAMAAPVAEAVEELGT